MNHKLEHQIGDVVYQVESYCPVFNATFEEALTEDTVRIIIASEEMGYTFYSCNDDIETIVEDDLLYYPPELLSTKAEAKAVYEKSKKRWFENKRNKIQLLYNTKEYLKSPCCAKRQEKAGKIEAYLKTLEPSLIPSKNTGMYLNI